MLTLIAAALLAAPQPPNVVVILADDLGIEGVGCYGGTSYSTPNIDRLAAGGMQFTHCFSNPLCSPSRAELLTGREPLHNGIPRVIFDATKHREFLDPAEEQTVANLFQDAGYHTAMAGKWQLSFLHERDTINALGFDEYQAWQIFRDGVKTSRFADPSLRRNGQLAPEKTGGYGPDENCRFITDFIDRHKSQPFFAYYACLLPHYPWEPTPNSVDPLKKADGLGDKKYFPDMVAYLDTIVGRVIKQLEDSGVRDNTLVVFVADNGTDKRLTSDWTDGRRTANVAGGKGTMTDAGTRVPLIVSWPGTIKPGQSDRLVELCDLLPTLGHICQLAQPRNPINGRSFADQLLADQTQPTAAREWVHVQNQKRRHVRSKTHILNERNQLRPIVRIGEPAADPITGPLSPNLQRERQKLSKALTTVESFNDATP